MARSHSSKPSTQGGGGGGGDPPQRRTAAGGADDAGNVAAAQERVAMMATVGRPGAPSSLTAPIKGPAAKMPLREPNNRHILNSIRPKSPAKGKNTIVLPGTDVAGDLAQISAGHATWNPTSNRYKVNGRTYAVEDTGTVIPVSGPGFVDLSRPAYKVLKQLIGSNGDIDAARRALARDPAIGDAEWRSALDVFQHHKSYRGEA
ncbi:hypothetical protein Ade02nite_25150 [Paractinoplanes deccanensis]|uniref:Uncharacterized protein n=2 Tax=Paractinoplanes deccanensis TaxID=113561 RepID=A0ABQ3Y1L0_9ACTN|nr:hypothetical protein Ade02nite_25150 [Actinoplanes deccanensis]